MPVFHIVMGPKYTLAASHAAPSKLRWICRRDRQTDRRTPDRYTTLSGVPLDAASVESMVERQGDIPSVRVVCPGADSAGKCDWSWTRWPVRAARWPARHSASRSRRPLCPWSSEAPCRRTCLTHVHPSMSLICRTLQHWAELTTEANVLKTVNEVAWFVAVGLQQLATAAAA